MNQQIATLVVNIIRNYKTLCEYKIVGKCFTVQQLNNFILFIALSLKLCKSFTIDFYLKGCL